MGTGSTVKLDPVHEFGDGLTACALAVAKYTITSRLNSAVTSRGRGLCGSASWPRGSHCCPTWSARTRSRGGVALFSPVQSRARHWALCAGVALAFGSIGVCFALNAASFVVVVVMFAFVRAPLDQGPH